MTNLYTIGYENAQLSDFLRSLLAAGVRTVVDVRELPLSRRKGFSKTSLAGHLGESGIKYLHTRELGAPREIRNRLREDGDLRAYFVRFDAYLKTQGSVLQRLATELEGAVALLCFEKNPLECHRSSVARELGRVTRQKPVHLAVEKARGNIQESARMRAGEGIPAS